MESNLKEIKPGVGLGNLKFGITRNDVKKMLGEPTETEKYSYTDTDQDLTESWHYDELELSLSFDEDFDWKLSTIAVSSDDYEFKGKKIVGLTKTELLPFLNANGINDLEPEELEEDEDDSSILLISDKNSISFYFEDNILSEIQWGPTIVDDEAVIWPE